MNKLDKLFNKKLAEHIVTPSADTWQKLEAGLSKKNSSLIWLRWAAVLLPGVTLLGVFWLNRPETEAKLAKEVQPKPAQTEVNNQESNSPLITAVKPKTATKKNSPSAKHLYIKSQDMASETIIPIVVPESQPESSLLTVQATNEAALVQAQTVAVQSKPIVLVYTLDTVAPQAEEGASAVEKKSSIQRVVAFANDVKHSDPLSEFRGMKEELLAINLRKKTSKKN